jgi:hypothetical protein
MTEHEALNQVRIGSASSFVRFGVSPLLRLTPPRQLLAVEPDHVLVGHGEGIHEDAAAALREAITLARRRTPSWA